METTSQASDKTNTRKYNLDQPVKQWKRYQLSSMECTVEWSDWLLQSASNVRTRSF